MFLLKDLDGEMLYEPLLSGEPLLPMLPSPCAAAAAPRFSCCFMSDIICASDDLVSCTAVYMLAQPTDCRRQAMLEAAVNSSMLTQQKVS